MSKTNIYDGICTKQLIEMLRLDFEYLRSGDWIPDDDTINESQAVVSEIERRVFIDDKLRSGEIDADDIDYDWESVTTGCTHCNGSGWLDGGEHTCDYCDGLNGGR